MRMDQSQELTAKQVVNEYSEEKLIKILYDYGEERFAKNIVRNIIEQRKRKTIITFHSLEDRAVKQAYIEAEGRCTCPKDLPYCVCGAMSFRKDC